MPRAAPRSSLRRATALPRCWPLQVEPSKTMAVKAFELALLDEEGHTIGQQAVNGLSYLKFPVNRDAGAERRPPA